MRTEPKFKSLIPSLTEEEYIQLEQNILQDGIREPLSVWNDTIIDGHNRYEIAQKHNLTYTTVNYEFENENDVIFWIIKNQFGRRNLTAYDRSVLALKLKPVIAEKAKENQIKSGIEYGKGSQKSDEPIVEVNTKKELAEIAGVSHDTIAKVEKIQEKAIEPVKELLKKDELSINQAEKTSKLDTETQEKILPYIRHGIKVDDALKEITDTEDEESETEYRSPKIRDMSEYLRNKMKQQEEDDKLYDRKLELGYKVFKELADMLVVINDFEITDVRMEALWEYYNAGSLDEQIDEIDEKIQNLQQIKMFFVKKGNKYGLR